MRVSVVVVTWNGLHLLQPCVAALEQQTMPHELVVVDNGSSDGTVEWLRRVVPDMHLVVNTDNQGFAQGNNIGIQHCSGDIIVLINNDTLPPPTFIADLVEPLRDDPALGAVAGVLVFAHQPTLVASAGIVPGMDGVHVDLDAMKPVESLSAHPVEIFGPSGGAAAFRRAALEDVGLFDAGYFNYLEDADLAWRLRLRGWKTVVAPRALIPHIYSATSGHASPRKQRLLARNRLRVLWRCWPTSLLRRHALRIVWYDLLAIAYAVVGRQPSIALGRWDALKMLPSMLKERRAIQQRATASDADLARWLARPRSIRVVLDEGKRLDAILRDRPPSAM